MAALSVSALCLLKCSVACKVNISRSVPIKVGQVKIPSLQVQRRSLKLGSQYEEEEEEDEEMEYEELQVGASLSEGIDKELLSKYGEKEYAEKATLEYTSAIGMMCFAECVDDALELKKCMETKKIALTPDTYFPIIYALCKEKKFTEAVQLFEEAKRRPGCEPNAFTYGALIEGMFRNRKPRMAASIMLSMIKDGVVPLEVTVVGIIKELCKNRCYSMATDLVHESLPPNIVYYKCLIEALGRAGEAGLAKDILIFMKQRGVDPDAASYSSALASCVKNNLDDEVSVIAREMKEKGFAKINRPGPRKIEPKRRIEDKRGGKKGEKLSASGRLEIKGA